MTDRIKEAITEWWGERCKHQEPGCAICDAWAEFDGLVAERDAAHAATARIERFDWDCGGMDRDDNGQYVAFEDYVSAHAVGFEVCREMAAAVCEPHQAAAQGIAAVLRQAQNGIRALQHQQEEG